jgi:hypothetical protein
MEKETQLTAWFKINREGDEAKGIPYIQMPQHFTWNSGKWSKRAQGGTKIVTRLLFVQPKERERYALRLLLLHHKGGATGFDSLKFVENVMWDTFYDAAISAGLVRTATESNDCMEEAAQHQFPKQLRQLFVVLIVFSEVPHPQNLFEVFETQLTEDFCKNGAMTQEKATLRCLNEMAHILKVEHGRELSEFGFSKYPYELYNHSKGHNSTETPVQHEQIWKVRLRTFNEEQCAIWNTVISETNTGTNLLHYIDGPAGSGKTYLYEALYHYFESQVNAFY